MYEERKREQYVERETARVIRKVIERDNLRKSSMTTDKGREKSGESEENRKRNVGGDTCHVCIEREKKIFTIFNSTECSCAALQLLLLVLVCKINVFLYFNDSHVYKEREKKSLQLSTQLNVVVRHSNCCCCLCWLVKENVFVFF